MKLETRAKNRKVFSAVMLFLMVILFQSAFIVTSDAAIAPIPTAVDGRILTPDKTGDTSNWVEIARNDGYSLIVRANFLNVYPSGHNGDATWQYCAYNATNSDYTNYNKSKVRDLINAWFNGCSTGTADKLPVKARLRDFSMQNNATQVLGTSCNPICSLIDGFSKPTIYQVGVGNDIAFALSYCESANFLSRYHFLRYACPASFPSSPIAQANYCKINIPSYQCVKMTLAMWLRSPGDASCGSWPMAAALGAAHDPRTFQINLTCVPASYVMGPPTCPFIVNTGAIDEHGLVYPALWVGSGIFETKGTIIVVHKDAVDGTILKQTSYTVNAGNYGPYNAETFAGYGAGTLAPGSAPASGTINVGETKTITYLYPRVVTQLKVTYNPNGGTGSVIFDSVNPNTYYAIRQNPGYSMPNQTFDGWNTRADGLGVSYSPGQIVYLTSSLTLYAKWKAIPPMCVTYNPNGAPGSPVVDYVNSGTNYTVRANMFSWQGFEFVCWNTRADGAGVNYSPGQVVYMTSPLVLYAKWRQVAMTQVIYIPNGGIGDIKVIDVALNSYYVISDQGYYWPNYTQNGWNTQPNGTGTAYQNGQVVYISGPMVIFAQWKQNQGGTQYKITYSPNGGVGQVVEVLVNANTYYTIVSQGYTKEYNKFDGWNTRSDGLGVNFEVGQSIYVTGDLTLYAKWVPNL